MFLKGLKVILTCAVLSAAVSAGLNYQGAFYSVNWWWSLVFFSVIFIGLNLVFLYRSDEKSMAEVVFGTILVKTLLLLVAIFLYSLADKPGLPGFSVHFIAHYILFTVFEIRYLLSVIKNKTK